MIVFNSLNWFYYKFIIIFKVRLLYLCYMIDETTCCILHTVSLPADHAHTCHIDGTYFVVNVKLSFF